MNGNKNTMYGKITKTRILFLLLFLATFLGTVIGNISVQNTNKQFLNKSFSIPVDSFLFNYATIDKEGNLYVANDMLAIVQKFDKNGQFIKTICINDDIYMIKNEDDGIHVYAGRFDNVDYLISKNKIISKKISEHEMNRIEADPRQNIIGNLWIHNGKITLLKTSIFPIDPEIIVCVWALIEGLSFIRKKLETINKK